MGKWLALWKYFKQPAEVKTPLATITYCDGLLAVYFEQHLHAGGILAATKEIQRVIDIINDGTLYLQGARTSTLRGKGTNWQIRC